MRTVTIVGAGFSGLSLAHYLRKEGFAVQVIEKQSRVGGLISTEHTDCGMVESAANAMIADRSLEEWFEELGVKFAEQKPERKKRYIFWEKPRRWPLTAGTTMKGLMQMARLATGSAAPMPLEGESIRTWSRRVVNAEFEERLLAPALQGIYAGDPERMSAKLVLKSLFGGRLPKGELKGSVAPERGMGELTRALYDHLRVDGVQFEMKKGFTMPEYLTEPLVLCTSAWNASEILQDSHAEIASKLKSCEALPLLSVTCFFKPTHDEPQGFGCLFPTRQGFTALGVLFPNCIFEGRSELRAETWILGGALRPELLAASDEQILEAIRLDRARIVPTESRPVTCKITRWPRAIPHYTLEWERTLKSLKTKPPLFLHGNYMGQLGLARIHNRSRELARQLKEMYG